MMKKSFVHLHNHTEYSFLDGICKIRENDGSPGKFIRKLKKCNSPAIAITDHGNMCGAIEFYECCKEVGIKPIIGCEVYVAPGSRFEKEMVKGKEKNYHLTLLAKNLKGYKNLMKITSIGYLEGFYHKPRVDKEILRKYSDGLICLSGCIHAEIPHTILTTGGGRNVENLIDEYKSIYGEDFYLELMDNKLEEHKRLIPILLEISKRTNTPVVVTNDCHYLNREDSEIHDVFLCVGTNALLTDQKRLRFPTAEFYYKTPEEIYENFSFIPEAIKNTIEIAEKCKLELKIGKLNIPSYKVEDPDEYLRKICEEGLRKRYPVVNDELKRRLDYELEIVRKKGLASYFLIVWDIVKFANENGIPVGPGRGSGSGSLITYCLGITQICPVKYGLLFERFLNPERKKMPDLDVDFADFGREKVIKYVKEKFGEENVAQIITFGSMMAKMAIRDVGRVMELPVHERDRIAKMVPFNLTLSNSLEVSNELREVYQSNKKIRQILDITMKLEGLKRQIGTHAAGIIITKGPLSDYTPLARSKEGATITQYEGDVLLKLGLLKIDILGLRILTVIDDCVKLIREKNPNFSIESIPLDDKNTFDLLNQGKTIGVFQFESAGMRDLLRKLKPTRFEDLIAAVALYRPGPIKSGMVDEFVNRKNKKGKIKFEHTSLEPILKETYGVIVYQEQVMEIAKKLAGFSAAEADVLREAMAKKISGEIAKQKGAFIEGALKNGLNRVIAEKVFERILHFGEYGFNKSHATAYALLAYRTAYLKSNFPLEYITSLLNAELKSKRVAPGKEEERKLVVYIKEAQQLGMKILPPDVNESDIYFTPKGKNLRCGLLHLKNVGESAAEAIINARRKYGQFRSLRDFLQKTSSKQVTRKTVESLIKTGAFDNIGGEGYDKGKIRAKLFKELESSRKSLQTSLFGEETEKETAPWPEHVLLAYEREILGFYISGHPLNRFQKMMKFCSKHSLSELPEEGSSVVISGMITNIKKLTSKNGREMMRFKLEDLTDEIDCVIFPTKFRDFQPYIENQSIVLLKGRLQDYEGKNEVIVDEVLPIEMAYFNLLENLAKVYLKISAIGITDEFLDNLKSVLESSPGQTRVYLKIITPIKEVTVQTDCYVKLNRGSVRELEKILGEEAILIP